jgi:phage-related protein
MRSNQSTCIHQRPLVQVGDDLWVVHAFQKKSTHGIKTPRHEIDLIRERLKRLKEILR